MTFLRFFWHFGPGKNCLCLCAFLGERCPDLFFAGNLLHYRHIRNYYLSSSKTFHATCNADTRSALSNAVSVAKQPLSKRRSSCIRTGDMEEKRRGEEV